MRLVKWATVVAGVVLTLNVSATAQEPVVDPPADPPVVQFLDINDAVPGRFFDARATAAAADDPLKPVTNRNKLVISFHSGIDWTTWKATEFRASTAAFSHAAAMDTLSFRIEAPAGFYIAKVTYSQGGRGSVLRLAKALGSSHWVVGNFAAHLGLFGANPTLAGEANLGELRLTSVPVSITTGLFSFAAGALGSANVEVTSAEVQVQLAPLTTSE